MMTRRALQGVFVGVALAAVSVCAAASPQGVTDLPEDLGAAISQAMANNPDIDIAEAELAAASAALRKARMAVTREVADAFNNLQNARENLARATQTYEAGLANVSDAEEASREVARLEFQLGYLLGLGEVSVENVTSGGAVVDSVIRLPSSRPEEAKRPPIPEKMAEVLAQPVNITFEDTSVYEVMFFAQEYYRIGLAVDPEVDAKITAIEVSDVPLKSALAAVIEAADQKCCLVVRDYGLLLTTTEKASRMCAPTIPPDVPYFAPGKPQEPTEVAAAQAAPQAKRPTYEGPLNEVLDAPMNVIFEDTELSEVINFMREYLDMPFTMDPSVGATIKDLNVQKLPLRQALEAITHSTDTPVCFVLRDYGVQVTTPEKASKIYAPTIPEDVPLDPEVAGRHAAD